MTDADTTAGTRPTGLRAKLTQWPVVVVMVLLWCALWQDFTPGVMLVGLLFALLLKRLLPLPPVQFPGRFHPWGILVFTLTFLKDVVAASIAVSLVVLLRPRSSRHSVVEVRLRSHDDLIVTLTSHALALVPGSIVPDVDRATATLYLHCLDAAGEERVDSIRRNALRVEARIIRAVGSAADLELVRRYPDSAPPYEDMDEYRRYPPHIHRPFADAEEADRR